MNNPAARPFQPAEQHTPPAQGQNPHEEASPQAVELRLQPLPLSAYGGSLALLTLGLSGIGCAIAVLLGHLPPGRFGSEVTGAIYGVPGLAFCVLSIPGWMRRSRSRGSLVLERDTLSLTRGGEPLRFPLQSLDFAVGVRPVLLGGTLHTLRLRTPEARGRVEQFIGRYDVSELDDFLELLAKRVATAARTRLAQGEFQGEGWRMDDKHLYHGKEVTPLSSIEALGWFPQRIAVWTSVQAPWRLEPVLNLDAQGFNAHVLAALAGRHLPPWRWVEDVENARLRMDARALAPGVTAVAQLAFPLFGDAAGEHLYMKRGQYMARIYVFLAFCIQACVASIVCMPLPVLLLAAMTPKSAETPIAAGMLLSLLGGGVLA